MRNSIRGMCPFLGKYSFYSNSILMDFSVNP